MRDLETHGATESPPLLRYIAIFPLIAYLGLAVFQYHWVGLDALCLASFGVGLHFAPDFFRAFRGPADTTPSQTEGSGARAFRLRNLLSMLLIVPLFAGLFVEGAVTVRGKPLLAGPEIRSLDVSRSTRFGPHAAEPGHYFLVADVVVGSRLGAPLRFLYESSFELKLNGARDGLKPATELPQECGQLQVPRWGSDGCRLVFQVPDTASSARLHVEEFQQAHSGTIDLSSIPPYVPRVGSSTKSGP